MNTNQRLALLASSIFLCLPLIADSSCCDKDYVYSKTHFSARPQGNYYFVNLMTTADITHRPENETNYFNCTATLGYRQNMDTYELGRYFFTQDGPVIVGPINTDVDIQNLQLGLAQNYRGSIVLQPTVSDIIFDVDLFAGFDQWVPGSWLRVHFPFVRNSWRPNMQSQTATVGAANYSSGFADTSTITVATVYQDVANAMCGESAFGKIPALDAGKLCCRSQSCTGLSDVHLEIGYDFIRRTHGNMGIALIGAGATGKPNGSACNKYLLTPTIGAQHSWQGGFALRGQYEVFNFDNEKTITLYGDARIAHVFAGCTKRLLSLNVGDTTAFNYWLLLNQYDQHGTYIGVERAANLLNKKVKVSAGAMGELSLMALTVKDQWRLALGYNLWYRSQENVSVMDMTLGSDYYTLKNTYTQSWGTSIADKTVSNISRQPAGTAVAQTLEHIKTQAIRTGDIDVCAAQHPATYSNTFFASAGYHFKETAGNPYVNLGGSIEFGRGNTALSTWGLYAQAGISI